jgi:hypothetical protein
MSSGSQRHPASTDDLQPWRRVPREKVEELGRLHGSGELDLGNLVAADDAEWEREGKDEARLGVEALGTVEGDSSAAHQALEGPQQIVMAQ